MVVIFGVYKFSFFITRKLIVAREKWQEETREKFLKYTRRGLKILFVILSSFVIGNFMGEEMVRYLTGFWKIVGTPFYEAGSSRISIVTVLLTIPVFMASSWLAKKVKVFLEKSVLNSLNIQASSKFSISKLGKLGSMVIFIIVGLSFIGIDFSAIVVILGVLGIGVGFGLQGIVANFFSGLVMFFERPVKEGDRIIINGVEGDVYKIRMLSTVVTTLNNESIFVPNAQLMGSHIHNYSYQNPKIIIVNKIDVSYDTDIEEAMKVLVRIGELNPYSMPKPEPEVRLNNFGDSGITLELRTWIHFANNKYKALSWTNLHIWKSFKEHHITIPYPQIDLHVKEPGNQPPLLQGKASGDKAP